MKRIFLVEDDLSLINGLSFAIQKQGYELDIARTMYEAETAWADGKYDLVILDVSLPDGSGFDICKKIRQTSEVPVLFLTAADEETDMIMGLDIGGDDYVTKPFKLAVFLSRINALLRRSNHFTQEDAELRSNNIRIQLLKGAAYKNDERLELTAGEYKLLRLFMENPDTVLSPEQILGRLWDCSENYVDGNTLTVYIRRLRKKIEDDPGNPLESSPFGAWDISGIQLTEVQNEDTGKQKNQVPFLQNPVVHLRVHGRFSRFDELSDSEYSALRLFVFFWHGLGNLGFLLWVFQGTGHGD